MPLLSNDCLKAESSLSLCQVLTTCFATKAMPIHDIVMSFDWRALQIVVWLSKFRTHRHIHTHTHTHSHTDMCACTHSRTHAHTHTHNHMYVHIWLRTYLQTKVILRN